LPGGTEAIGVESQALNLRGQAGDLFADTEVGRRDFTELSLREVVPDKLHNPGGVAVDRSVSPGRAYVWDSGNSRILGIDLTKCYAVPSGQPCEPSFVFGQPSGTDHGACNLDSTAQQYPNRPPASASTLCGFRETTHTVGEDKSFANMFVDSSGNLWVPDVMNNRVLEYNSPFTTGSTTATAVWGQADFTGNLCNGNTNGLASWLAIPNPTARSLCFWDPNGVGVGSGVRLDASGNLWVADGGNNRVLRFPKVNGVISKTADVELGQSPVSFASRTAGSGMNQLSSPSALLFDSSGNLYVADTGNGRVSVFKPNNGAFASGQSASFTFGSFNGNGPYTVELDPGGRGLWTTRIGGNGNYYSYAALWNFSGQPVTAVPELGFGVLNGYLAFSGGSIGFDAAGRMLASSYNRLGEDVARYSPQSDGSYLMDQSVFMPQLQPDGVHVADLTATNRFEGPAWAGVGVADHVISQKQVVVADGRLMFWNNPTTITLGQAPDGCVGSCGFPPLGPPSLEQVKVDASDRVWVGEQSEVDVFQAPLSSSSTSTHLSSFPVVGGGTVSFSASSSPDTLLHGIAPTPDGNYLWISQPSISRVFRVRGPLTASPVVDVVLGQQNLTGTSCNRGGTKDLTTLCNPGAISVDKKGNLWVSDHFIELTGNFRLLMFAASTFPANPSSVVYAPAATKEFPNGNPLLTYSMATFEPAFDSTNRMVVGFNPYSINPNNNGIGPQRYVQYFNNPTAVNPQNPSDPAYAIPTGLLEDYYGWPVAATFDSSNNLYVYDANRGRVNIYSTPFSSALVSAHGQYANGDPGKPNDNVVKPHFNLVNHSATAVPMSNFAIRYYFNTQSPLPSQSQFFNVDYAAIGNGYVQGRFVSESCGSGANNYLEVSFTGGTLPANGQSGEIQVRFNKSDWSSYSESTDYSYIANQTSYADSNTIAVYQSGNLIWGTPPSGCY
jgi:sugar lactone lactonase YvrE